MKLNVKFIILFFKRLIVEFSGIFFLLGILGLEFFFNFINLGSNFIYVLVLKFFCFWF